MHSDMKSDLLVIMSKAPKPGNVKSRLAKDLGEHKAALIMKSLLIDMVNIHLKGEYDLKLCAPIKDKKYEDFFLEIIPHVELTFLKGDELRGESSQLWEVFNSNLSIFKKVIAVNADTPFVTKSIISSAFASLDNNDLVIGPDQGLGYYLIGMKKPVDVFTTLSKKRTPYLENTLMLLDNNNIEYALARKLHDIDFLEDIAAIKWGDNKRNDFWEETFKTLVGLGLIKQSKNEIKA